MDNILQTLTIPQLGDPNFQVQFEEFCTAVANNFTRMVSIQYAKGEPGSSVYDATLNVDYDNGGITSLGATLLNTIFMIGVGSQNFIDPGDPINIVCSKIQHIAPNINNTMVFKEFMSSPAQGIGININIDDEQHIAYIAQPYIFIDERIENLKYLQDEYRESWHDFSIGIYGRGVYDEDLNQDVNDPNTWTWTLQAVAIVPKIYYDRNIHEFCWMVNEQQTGITAQGIKGDTGSGPAMIIAKGRREDTKLWIEEIQCMDEQGVEQWAALDDGVWKYGNVEVVGPKADDLAIVFWNRSGETGYQNAFVGKVYMSTNQPYLYIPADDMVPRLDIFASIKGQNLKELMRTINKGNQGFPRGLMIPADPVQLPHGSQTNPSTYHLIYSEIDNHDSQGRGKLHMTPTSPGDCEQSDQNPSDVNNPGEMVLDYNVRMRNLHVDTITIGDRQESPWNCKIKDPKLACMSRFKNFSYSLERQITRTEGASLYDSFKYTLKMSGILELNIGMLSVFNVYDDANLNVTQIWKFAHEAFESYGANWDSGDSPAFGGYSQDDKTYTDKFQESGSRDKSKLYNVVNYEIPFELNKEVTYTNQSPSSSNIFGCREVTYDVYAGIGTMYKSKLYDNSSNIFNEIQLKFGLIGWNMKAWQDNSPRIIGATICDSSGNNIGIDIPTNNIDINNDIDDIYISDPYGANASSSDWGSQYRATVYNAPNVNMCGGQYEQTRTIPQQTPIGEVGRLIEILKNISSGNDFELTGGLYYEPLEYTLNYKFDIYSRIFEIIDFEWGKKQTGQGVGTTGTTYPKKMYHKLLLKLVPVGCVQISNQSYQIPIWNALNIKNENINDNSLSNYKTLLNPLVTDDISIDTILIDDWEQPQPITHYDRINEPDLTGIIMHEENVSSDYIISVFTDENKQTPHINDLETTYYDVMNNVRVVTDNLKVCPNNVNDGNWMYDSEQASYGWKSFKEVPYVIMPCDGYIGSTQIGTGTGEISKDKVKLGCANLKSNSAYWPMTLHGVLMYPYTSGILRGKRPNNSLQFKCLNDTYEDATPILPNVEVGHYPDGKMMGVTNGLINGIVASNNIPGPVTPTPGNPYITNTGGQTITTNTTTVTIDDTTAGADASIYYTTDGSTPSENNGTLYTTPFTLNIPSGFITIKAIAILNGESSEVTSYTITRDSTTTYYVAVTQRSGDKDNSKYRVRISANNPPQIPSDELPVIWMDSIDVHPGNDYIYGQIAYYGHGPHDTDPDAIMTGYNQLSLTAPEPNNLGDFGQPGTQYLTGFYGSVFKISINDTHMVYPYFNGLITEGDVYRESVYLRIRQDMSHIANHQVILRTNPVINGQIYDDSPSSDQAAICTKSPSWISQHPSATAIQDFELQIPEDETYIYGQFMYYGPSTYEVVLSSSNPESPMIRDSEQQVVDDGGQGTIDPDTGCQWGFRFKIGKNDSGRIFDITYGNGDFKTGTPTS